MEIIFWLSLCCIAGITVGYPIIVVIVAFLIGHKKKFTDNLPTVSLIISAYNEEKVIKAKIENSLTLDYPVDKLEIIVASDGSTDKTNTISALYAARGVKLYVYDRLGKTGIQNKTVEKATGEILVFSDANAIYHPEAIKKLVRNFGDLRVSCVGGQLIYEKGKSKAEYTENIYWKYEKLLKQSESNLSSSIGVNGSIYAIKKSDYVELDPLIISDLVEPLEIVKNKKRVVYEPEAISVEEGSESFESEFNRKVRILTRSIQGLLTMKELLNPMKFGIFSIQLFFHKFCRYLIPLFWLLALFSLIFLINQPVYSFFMALFFIFSIMALIGKITEKNGKGNKLFSLAYYYIMTHYALILAWFRVIKNEKITVWKTQR